MNAVTITHAPREGYGDPRLYAVWIRNEFFLFGGLMCSAVVDDFGDLVQVS